MRETVAVVYSGAGAGGVRGGLVEMSPRHPKNYVTNAEGDDVHVDAAAAGRGRSARDPATGVARRWQH